MLTRYKGRSVGIDALASAIGENPETIKNIVEPFLVRKALINRGLRGRELTDAGKAVATMAMADLTEW